MKFFYRILLSLFPLIVASLVLGMVLTVVRGNAVIRELVLRNGRLELNSLLGECEEEYRVLESLGIEDIDFYRKSSQEKVIDYALNRDIPSGFLYIKQKESLLNSFPEIDESLITFEEPFSPWNWLVGMAVSRNYLLSFSRETLHFTLILLSALLVPAGFLAYYLSKRISSPLVQLENTAIELSRGVLSARAEVPKDLELGNLARAVNTMAENIETLTGNLERRVKERTIDLQQALDHLKEAQDRLIQSEKLSALGNLTSGIAHELNTPLGAVLSINESLLSVLMENIEKQWEFRDSLTKKERNLVEGLLQQFMDQEGNPDIIVDRGLRFTLRNKLEKVFCKDYDALIDAVLVLQAHHSVDEILSILKLPGGEELIRYTASLVEPINLSRIIKTSARQAVRVTDALRSYIETGEIYETEAIDLAEAVDAVLVLLQNKIRPGVTVSTRYAVKTVVKGNRHLLNLVLLNLIKNALDAMEYNGRLTIETYYRNGNVCADISDNGKGISPDICDRIFDPFFTTKTAGTGIGLGLDISRNIIIKLGGNIHFTSKPGETHFIVCLPCEGWDS